MNTTSKRSTHTRNLEKTRAKILEVTFDEVFLHGFQGVSVDDIVAKTPFTKGALYHQFPTKLELGYALVEEVITPMIIARWIAPLDAYHNPLEGILVQLKKLVGDVSPNELKLGCPLNNLVQEMSPLDAGFKRRLQKALNLWVDELDRHLKRAQCEGYIKNDVDTREVAQFVVITHEGFFGLMKGLGDPSLFNAMFGSLKTYLSAVAA